MDINWNNIRSIEGQNEGFEELVCQLAGREVIKDQKQFVRMGKPDAGKECFWRLNNGDRHFWQAKYFLKSFDSSQWTQIDESVKTAINNHDDLKYYCISTPVDMPDGAKGKSMLKKWEEYVKEWEKVAKSQGKEIEFDYWGNHELTSRLIKKKNEGLKYYFFNLEEFSDEWFKRKNDESIDSLNNRYTPEINISTPISENLSGLSRSKGFENLFKEKIEELVDALHDFRVDKDDAEIKKLLDDYPTYVENAIAPLRSIQFQGNDEIDSFIIEDRLTDINGFTAELESLILDKSDNRKGTPTLTNDEYFSISRAISKLETSVEKFLKFNESVTCKLGNSPKIIIVGKGGIGKSHLLADFVKSREEEGLISLLLLGENFSTDSPPWTQILRNQLLFEKNEDVFLGALNSKAESMGKRILIIIDALNEGKGKKIWPRKFKSFLKNFDNYPWLGIVASLRDTSQKLIIPDEDYEKENLLIVKHYGFEGMEFKASSHFFEHYDISAPDFPILNTEFQNPLFLKLFCQGISIRGLKEIPNGYQGITAIIKYYLESIEEKLASPYELDYDVRLKLMQKSIDAILQKMTFDNVDHVKYEEGEKITRDIFYGKCSSSDVQYLNRLISEGVINSDLYWDKMGNNYDGVHFAYQRFQDHLIIEALLDKYLDDENPEKAFNISPLKELLEENRYRKNQNLIEALSIQVPERTGKELFELAPYIKSFSSTVDAFIESLSWRKKEDVGEGTLKYINEVIGKDESFFYNFLETTLSMATVSDYQFNADRLHKNLISQKLNERDSWWTIWLHDKYGDNSVPNAVKSLVNWAWSTQQVNELSDESIRLAAVALSWFLTSSNRYLRDSTTKALINLLKDRIDILIKVLKKFEGVNDIYITERLYAVSYGCSLRTNNDNFLKDLSLYIYGSIFNKEMVISNILLRDYARGVIEYSIMKTKIENIDLEKVRPPYNSVLTDEFPSNEEIDMKYKPKGNLGHHRGPEWGSTAILASMTTEYGRKNSMYGDFGRYTFQRAFRLWNVNYDKLSNYAVQRIFEIGYDPKLFSDFDANQANSRYGSHMERIGKKYQWIIFHELLAKVSDNYDLKDESSFDDNKKTIDYEGPWYPYVRDIDPTILIKENKDKRKDKNRLKVREWLKFDYDNWGEDSEEWMEDESTFPTINELLELKDDNGNIWFNLNTHIDWDEPKSLFEKKDYGKGKRVWFDITSFLVKNDDLKKIINVKSDENTWSNWSTNHKTEYKLFSREYHWSPGWLFFNDKSYYEGESLPYEIVDPNTSEVIADAFTTATEYRWEAEQDCSKTDVINYLTPNKIISSELNRTPYEGEFINQKSELVCFDPGVNRFGDTCLLFRKDHLAEVLNKLGLRLVFICKSEKQILGPFSDKVNFRPELSALFYLDDDLELNGEIKTYITNF